MNRTTCLAITLFFAIFFALPKAKGQIIINGHLIFTNCDSQTFRIQASNYDTSLRVLTYFGDGGTALDTFFNGGTTSTRSYFNHLFPAAGIYTIKNILFLHGVAVDSIVYSDTVTTCHAIHITSYTDNNADCVFNTGDDYMPNPYTIEIDSSGVPIDTMSATSFYYNASGSAPTGTIYTFRILTMPSGFMVTCPVSGIVRDTIGSSAGHHYFGFNCDTASFDLSIYGWFSPGVTGACAHTYARNYGCTPQVATVTLYYSPKYTYTSVVPSSIIATTAPGMVTFNVGTLSPAAATSFIAYFAPVGTPVSGDTTNSMWTVSPTTGDSHPANNTFTRIDSVRASFDPNEKAVSPQGYIYAGTNLEYKVGFENTGNDTAYNIHVQDTLSDNVNINTFKLISASSPVDIQFTTWAGHNIVKFDFAHINLMDATHPGQNTGMVVFTINAKVGLPFGTLINNKAGIYFDYNTVVMTNRVTNIIGYPAGISSMETPKASVWPNPATNVLSVKAPMGTYNMVTITSVAGQTLLQQKIAGDETNINISQLAPGFYFIRLTGTNTTETQKFSKR